MAVRAVRAMVSATFLALVVRYYFLTLLTSVLAKLKKAPMPPPAAPKIMKNGRSTSEKAFSSY